MEAYMPCVNVYVVNESEQSPIIQEILHGLEEENIPFRIESRQSTSGEDVNIAYQAALESTVGVGICISPNGIVVHYRRLSIDKPLFDMSANVVTMEKARLIGQNAARLIKGVPFELGPGR